MSVHLLKDGRWVVQYQDRDNHKKYKREYFGRGLEAEIKARIRNDALTIIRKPKKKDIQPKIKTKRKTKESAAADRLILNLQKYYIKQDIKTESKIEIGRIDILTPDEIIEVKNFYQWKSGLGQLLAYEKYFDDNRCLRLHLFGKKSPDVFTKILTVCKKFNISVTHDEGISFLPDKIKQRLRRRFYKISVEEKMKNPKYIEQYRTIINKIPNLNIPI